MVNFKQYWDDFWYDYHFSGYIGGFHPVSRTLKKQRLYNLIGGVLLITALLIAILK